MKRTGLMLLAAAAVLALTSAVAADSKDGARRWTRTVKKQSEVVYKVVFVASKDANKQYAEFALIGDGGTDIDIIVFDADGKEVASDTKPGDLAHVRWVPVKTQEYTIKVRNLGDQDNACAMGHN